MALGSTFTDTDSNLRGTHPRYHWLTDPELEIDRDLSLIYFAGEKIGHYMVRGMARGASRAGSDSYITVMISENSRPTMTEARVERLKRLLAAALLYRRVAETKDSRLTSRIRFRYVKTLPAF